MPNRTHQQTAVPPRSQWAADRRHRNKQLKKLSNVVLLCFVNAGATVVGTVIATVLLR